MSLPVYFNSQISAIVDGLAKTAIAEITKLVEEGTVVLRLEMRRRDSEIEDLKRSLIMERELRKSQEAAARMTSDRLHAVGIQAGSPVKDIQEEQTTHYSHSDSDQPLVEHCGLGPLVKSEPVEEQPADTGHDTRELTSNFMIEGRDDQLWHPESHAVCGTDLVDPEISSTIEKCLQMFSQTDQYPTHSNNTEMACSFSSTAGKSIDEAFNPVAIKVEPDTQPSACMGDVMLVPIQPGQGQCGNAARTVASGNLTLPALLQAERMTEGMPGPNTAYNPEHYVNRNRFRAKRMGSKRQAYRVIEEFPDSSEEECASGNEAKDLPQFKASTARALINAGSVKIHARGRPSTTPPPAKRRAVSKAPPEIRYAPGNHWPQLKKAKNASRCKDAACTRRTKYTCMQCFVSLCPGCFSNYHRK